MGHLLEAAPIPPMLESEAERVGTGASRTATTEIRNPGRSAALSLTRSAADDSVDSGTSRLSYGDPGSSHVSQRPMGRNVGEEVPLDWERLGLLTGGGSLTESDLENLKVLIGHQITDNTLRSYRSQWRRFAAWTKTRRVSSLPAEPDCVAAYLAERSEALGHKPATLRVASAAIAFVHEVLRLDNPCAHPHVRGTLSGAARKRGGAQKQAKGLTREALEAITKTACRQRIGRGGRLERPHMADARGRLDIALVSLMRDALLRVSEAAALTWGDIETAPEGSGRLLIRRSKTDQRGDGAVVFVSPQTMAALDQIRGSADCARSVFGLGPNQISIRIKQAAVAAGLGEGFSGHSPRVGMAQDLVRAGIELPGLMTAGRWRSPIMPAHYARKEAAHRGAVAQYYRDLHHSG